MIEMPPCGCTHRLNGSWFRDTRNEKVIVKKKKTKSNMGNKLFGGENGGGENEREHQDKGD
jgi:hypothetical protein